MVHTGEEGTPDTIRQNQLYWHGWTTVPRYSIMQSTKYSDTDQAPLPSMRLDTTRREPTCSSRRHHSPGW